VPSARKERKKHIFACACQSRIIVRVGSTLYLPNMFSSEELLLIGIHLDKKNIFWYRWQHLFSFAH
jgi:hypothetical protein